MKRILLCSFEMPECVTGIFERLSYRIERIPCCTSLSSAVSYHPDMIFSVMSDGSLITDKTYFESNGLFFDRLIKERVKISVSERTLSSKYPSDILFDAIKIETTANVNSLPDKAESLAGDKGCLLIGNLEHTAPELLAEATKTVNVSQGYALCSTLLMKGAAVCADVGICKALTDNGYDVLKIDAGGIALPGYGYGFIGGASAVLENEKIVVFFGNIYEHLCGEKIVGFCEKHGYRVLCTEKNQLTDYGGVKVV